MLANKSRNIIYICFGGGFIDEFVVHVQNWLRLDCKLLITENEVWIHVALYHEEHLHLFHAANTANIVLKAALVTPVNDRWL